MKRLQQGAVLRFDSVTAIIEFCRHRFQTNDLTCSSTGGELVLRVVLPNAESFETLIVHFEGEATFAVLLPV